MSQDERTPDRAPAAAEAFPVPDDHHHLVYSVAEVAALLRVSRRHMYYVIHQGEIPSLRVGKRLLVPRDAIEALIRGKQPAKLGDDGHTTPSGD